MERKNNAVRYFSKILTLILCAVLLCCGQLSAAEADSVPSIVVGDRRETVSLSGEWNYFIDAHGGAMLPEQPPENSAFQNTVSLPSYFAAVGQNERIWYQKTFSLANQPTEAVMLDFGSDATGAAAVYVNGVKADVNIAPLLHIGENTIVLLRQPSENTAFIPGFTDGIDLVFCNAPVITSVQYETDPEDSTVSFEIGLYNPRKTDLKTDVAIAIRDADGAQKGSFVLENVDVLAGSNTSASVSGIEIEGDPQQNRWTAGRPYVYMAEITTSGDRYTEQFALRDEAALFGAEGHRYGTDLIVSDFFAREENRGETWSAEWVTAFFKLIKDFHWNVITYRDGNLPECWQETALREGILLVDKNQDAEWAAQQDSLWTRETDLLAKTAEIKERNPEAVIIPVLYDAADGLFHEIPALSGVSTMRLKHLFSDHQEQNTPSVPKTDGGNAFVRFFKEIGTYFKEMCYKTFIKDNRYKMFLSGLGNTLFIAVAATGFGVIIGMLIAIIKVWYHQNTLAKKKNSFLWLLNFLAEFYTTVIRGTPVVVQLLITYNIIFVFSDKAVLIGIFAFSVNSGAYVSEIIRAGINSVDKGQTEAGRSLGLSQVTTMKSIVLPQAFKNILPALGNEFIAVLKETSVIGYLGVIDLTRAGELVRSRTADAFFTLLFVALIYLVFVFGLSAVFKRFERRLNKSDRN